jgi:hypothetical protein
MIFTARHHRNDQRRAKRRAARFFNRFFISPAATAPFSSSWLKRSRPSSAIMKKRHGCSVPWSGARRPGAKDVFQLFARRSRVGQT